MCATRTFVMNSPHWALWSPQGDRPVRFAAARRRARGSACKTRRGKFPPTPPIARAKPAAAAIPAQNVISRSIGIHPVKPSLKAAGVSGAPPTAAHPSDAHAAQVCFVLGSPRHLAMQRARDSAEVVSRFMRHLSRRATLCLSALHSLRQAVEAVGHYAQGLSGLADLPCGRRGIRISRPVARHALRQFAAPSALGAPHAGDRRALSTASGSFSLALLDSLC